MVAARPLTQACGSSPPTGTFCCAACLHRRPECWRWAAPARARCCTTPGACLTRRTRGPRVRGPPTHPAGRLCPRRLGAHVLDLPEHGVPARLTRRASQLLPTTNTNTHTHTHTFRTACAQRAPARTSTCRPLHLPDQQRLEFYEPAGELLDLVRSGQLAGAVDDCLAAAAAELDPLKQAALIKASAYGRAFQALEPSGPGGGGDGNAAVGGPVVFCGIECDRRRRTHEVARRLRVLNALREPGGRRCRDTDYADATEGRRLLRRSLVLVYLCRSPTLLAVSVHSLPRCLDAVQPSRSILLGCIAVAQWLPACASSARSGLS